MSSVTAAEFLRAQALRGANLDPDPRGVDYSLFESQSDEYAQQKDLVAATVSSLPAPVASMQRAIHRGDYAAALKLFGQLQELETHLDTPLAEYASMARWCVASGAVKEALTFLARTPLASEAPRRTHHDVTQTLAWLVRSGDIPTMQRAILLAAEREYIHSIPSALLALYQGAFGGTTEAAPYWCVIAAALQRAGIDTVTLSHLFQRVVQAQIRARYPPMHEGMPSTSRHPHAFFPWDATTSALARGEAVTRRQKMTKHDQMRFHYYERAKDTVRMRSVLLGALRRNTLPPVELVATLLCATLSHTHILMPASDAQPAYRVSTGAFLRPLRRRLQPCHGLWETATLRALEKSGDWQAALRLWQLRFEPLPGIRESSMEELLSVPHTYAPTSSYGAAVARNSARRPTMQRDVRPRIVPTPYACATALRAMVRGYGPQGKALGALYSDILKAMVPGGPTATTACFEAFIAMASRVDAKRFLSQNAQRQHTSQLPTMWSMLADMRAMGTIPRATTWTLFLQALLRDPTRAHWRMALRLLRHMTSTVPTPSATPSSPATWPRATRGTYTGLLHVLQRRRPTARTRRQHRVICKMQQRDEDTTDRPNE